MSNKFGLYTLIGGIALRVIFRNEKPKTDLDLSRGDDMSLKGLSELMILLGGSVLVYNKIKK